jgi:hypothetical protein
MQTVTVIYAKRYSFTNRETGELVEGVTVQYLPDEIANKPDEKGQQPVKLSMPVGNWNQVESVPGKYDMDFDFVPDSRGNVKVKLRGLQFVGE